MWRCWLFSYLLPPRSWTVWYGTCALCTLSTTTLQQCFPLRTACPIAVVSSLPEDRNPMLSRRRKVHQHVQWNMKEVKLNLVWNKHKFSFCFNTTSTVQSSKFDFELLIDFLYTVLSWASTKIWGCWVITRRRCFNGSTIPAQGPTPDAKLAPMGLNGLASLVNTCFVEANPTM